MLKNFRSLYKREIESDSEKAKEKQRDREVAVLEVTALAKKHGLEVSDLLSQKAADKSLALGNVFLPGSVEHELRLLTIHIADGSNLLCSLIAQLIERQEVAARSARLRGWGLLLLGLIALLLWRR